MKKFYFDIETLPAEEDKHEILKKIKRNKNHQGGINDLFCHRPGEIPSDLTGQGLKNVKEELCGILLLDY